MCEGTGQFVCDVTGPFVFEVTDRSMFECAGSVRLEVAQSLNRDLPAQDHSAPSKTATDGFGNTNIALLDLTALFAN